MINLKAIILEELENVYNEMAYPSSFSFDEFNKISSHIGKLRYANTHLQRITSGSSRTVYKVDDEKVLKIAKNKKGLDQNASESDWSIHSYGISATVFNHSEDDFWVEMELAKRVSPSRFKALTGISFVDLQVALRHLEYRSKRYSVYQPPKPDPKIFENEFYQNLERFIYDYDFPTGDLARLNSYGEVLREGEPKIVLIDFGGSRHVINKHYNNF
jgi:hypothetical protein